ncbi:hypothetical protein HPB49_016859 [Dermacentor silvarum]|uniref:Uncharacterized protein n=1 Tax=Dermacentor silvarum TaxID=543639 RepID=A0ACB8DEA1_DERSI|nr:hypothetical protein HPB49_016859 [Dermacentor silvarum]
MAQQPTSSALRALGLEFKSLQEEPVEGFRVKLVNDDNLFEWEVAIFGPPDTLYEGGYFKAHMKFPPDYPYSPPTVRFLTKVWHPNVYEPRRGHCHLGLFPKRASSSYSPINTVDSMLVSEQLETQTAVVAVKVVASRAATVSDGAEQPVDDSGASEACRQQGPYHLASPLWFSFGGAHCWACGGDKAVGFLLATSIMA